jgi:outer membrane protein assembly factor BamB
MKPGQHGSQIAVAVLAVAVVTFGVWIWPRPDQLLRLRIPGADAAPGGETGGSNPVLAGKLIPGPGQPSDLPGSWPQFRGLHRDGQAERRATDQPAPARTRDWKATPPREVWSLDVGEGYAGVAVRKGRVYLLDYDRDAKQSALRCLSLADGKEIWRYTYPLTIKRNHGMTRTVPTVTDQFVIALDSKCNVFCLDATSGELKWTVSLVREFGAAVPEWYAGQCPLVDGDRLILAPGGKDALLLALDLATGKPIWQTPNPHDWKMTHSSIMPMDFAGRRQYVYCASKGVVGVEAKAGALLWETTDWKISIANVPSPVPVANGKIFLTGGYNAGSLMLQLEETNEVLSAKTSFKLAPAVFGATQHTPILKDNHLYGIRADGRFVCLDLDGKVVWSSGSGESFGLGPLLLADDLIYALNDSGKLSLIEATPAKFNLLAQMQILTGRESWGPMALAGQQLLLRDLTRLVCLDVSAK